MSKKIVKVGDIECGSKELFLISGPCVIEEESIMMKTAEKLREVQERLKIKIIYLVKNYKLKTGLQKLFCSLRLSFV